MALAAVKSEYKLLGDVELKQHVTELGLDPVGPRTTLLHRIARHLAMTAPPHQHNGTTTATTTNGDKKAPDAKKRRKPKKKSSSAAPSSKPAAAAEASAASESEQDEKVEIEYVAAPLEVDENSAFADFAKVFAKFEPKVEEEVVEHEEAEGETNNGAAEGQSANGDAEKEETDDSDAEGEAGDGKVSRKKARKMNRLTVAELKQLVRKPEVVDWVDVTGADPKLLVHLKSYRNTVPVPVHWSQKRKYLQGKRGIEKAPFELPDFIKATGIMEMRSAVKEKEDASKLKSKTRERHQPKMGKLDIDYQKLHDAFFRWQTKPKFSLHGDVYYEGKEFETKLKAKKPGQLSEELKAALNMPHLAPPPWLINMQRYGPPPSYPQLKIAGLNAPIPEGAQWGYHPGGWGKPPVDEYGRPLYGDVFGSLAQEVPSEHVTPIERTPWGELEEEEEEEVVEESSEGEEDEEADEDDTATDSGLVTPSGIASVPSGLETPDFIELRKDSRREEPKQLYTVVPERQKAVQGFMGSQHTYDLSGAAAVPTYQDPTAAATSSATKGAKRKGGPLDGSSAIDVALNPEDLEEGLNDEAMLRKKYDQQLHVSKPNAEDFSDLVAEHASKQAKKKQKKDDTKAKEKDKSKNFKF
ncbi:Splicing factor 3B subunit 2 [Geranomyces michiganensis]|nr:Splicing factor 3B subunit 2 [Geranomyces michiganensis]